MNYIKWKIRYNEEPKSDELVRAGYTPLLTAMLGVRGIANSADAESFLSGGAELLHDPLLMKDMDKAALRVRAAIEAGESIAVYGDYDVDGITATCLLTDWLQSKGISCYPYIPDRMEEGYGLNSNALSSLKDKGVSLIISVDCGITAVKEAEFASEIGIDLVITDHHECREQELPKAVAVVDPKQDGCIYPNKDLAGVGVAMKLISAVDGDNSGVIERYADLVTIGTVADVVSLTGENRFIVRRGLSMIENTARPGIAALMKEAAAQVKHMTSSTIGFIIAPRLNAAGRLGCVSVALDLLMTHSQTEAEKLARELCELNRQRQALETDIWDDASQMMSGQKPESPIVLASEKWHQGVIGIAASKLAEQYSVPTVMICLNGEKGKGSCRSFGGFNLFDALTACSEHLEGFGGHALAAGLNIKREKLREFREALCRYYKANHSDELPTLNCDFQVIAPGILDMAGVRSLDRLEPFGNGNPRPVLCICGAKIDHITAIGGGRHLRFSIRYRDKTFQCVYFSHTQSELGVNAGDTVDIAFTPQVNDFRSKKTVQLQTVAVRRHDPRPMCRQLIEQNEQLPVSQTEQYCPERVDFVSVWRRLQAAGGRVASDLEGLIRQCPKGIEPERYCICLMALHELGLLKAEREGSFFGARIVENAQKVNLEDAPLIRRLKARS